MFLNLKDQYDANIAFFATLKPEWDNHTKLTYLKKYHGYSLITKFVIIFNIGPKTVASYLYGYLLNADLKDKRPELNKKFA